MFKFYGLAGMENGKKTVQICNGYASQAQRPNYTANLTKSISGFSKKKRKKENGNYYIVAVICNNSHAPFID